jgi:hypothetical protein
MTVAVTSVRGVWVFSCNPAAACALDEPPEPIRLCRRCGYRRHACATMQRYRLCDQSHGRTNGRTNDDEQGRGGR